VIIALLAIDLLVHRDERAQSQKNALVWSVVWIAAGLGFNVFVWIAFGRQAAAEYLAAYLLEKSLSLDNLFVFLVIFRSLQVPQEHQHRVLFWGILGAFVFRALFIILGTAVIERWDWVSYVFGTILLYAAFRAFREDPALREANKTIQWLSRHLPVTERTHERRFVVRENGRLIVTPVLIALVGIELTDIMFAIDSVAAALAITQNRFVLYSSNVFAILGLRALYLLLSQTIAKLTYLHYGLAAVLAFAGLKLILHRWVDVPASISVGIIAGIIGASVWASVRSQKRRSRQTARLSEPPDGHHG
jgi:tellurite resistance protein TerC